MSLFISEVEDFDIKEFVQSLQSREYASSEINTLPKLSDIIYGFNTGMYYLIPAMSGAGKTTLTIQMMASILVNHYANDTLDSVEFVYFELEINRVKLRSAITSFLIFYLTKGEVAISLAEILKLGKNKLTNEQILVINQFDEVINKIMRRIRFVKKKEVATPSLFKSYCEDIIDFHNENPDGEYFSKVKIYFVIDHISILGNHTKALIDTISSTIVELKEEYLQNVIYIALQQLNRDMFNANRRQLDGDNIEVTPNDLKDSGNPLQDCDTAICIFNPYLLKNLTIMSDYVLDKCSTGLRRFDILKNRYGELVSIRCFMGGGRVFIELGNPTEQEYSRINKLIKKWQK